MLGPAVPWLRADAAGPRPARRRAAVPAGVRGVPGGPRLGLGPLPRRRLRRGRQGSPQRPGDAQPDPRRELPAVTHSALLPPRGPGLRGRGRGRRLPGAGRRAVEHARLHRARRAGSLHAALRRRLPAVQGGQPAGRLPLRESAGGAARDARAVRHLRRKDAPSGRDRRRRLHGDADGRQDRRLSVEGGGGQAIHRRHLYPRRAGRCGGLRRLLRDRGRRSAVDVLRRPGPGERREGPAQAEAVLPARPRRRDPQAERRGRGQDRRIRAAFLVRGRHLRAASRGGGDGSRTGEGVGLLLDQGPALRRAAVRSRAPGADAGRLRGRRGRRSPASGRRPRPAQGQSRGLVLSAGPTRRAGPGGQAGGGGHVRLGDGASPRRAGLRVAGAAGVGRRDGSHRGAAGRAGPLGGDRRPEAHPLPARGADHLERLPAGR